MPNTILVSPIACIDPTKPKSNDIEEREANQECMLEILLKKHAMGQLDLNVTIKDLFGENFVDWKNHPYGEAYSCQPAISSLSFRPHLECLKERLEVIKILVERGYDARVLAPTTEIQRYQRSYGLSQAEGLGAKLLDTTEQTQQLTDWCRDGQMQIKNITYNAPDLNDDWFAKLGCKKPRFVSRLGEGGRAIESDGFALIAADTDEASVQSLQKDGLRTYKLPSGIRMRPFYNRKNEVVARANAECDHIDLFVNTIDAGRLMIVDPTYFMKAAKELKAIGKQEGYEILKIPACEENLALTNFLTLPDGMILMNKSERLYRDLKRRDLTEHIITTQTRHHFNSDSILGGIRCYTNVVKT